MKRPALGLLIVLLLSAVSHADSIFAVTGQATFTGFALCGASACVETLHFSFELGVRHAADRAGAGFGFVYRPEYHERDFNRSPRSIWSWGARL